MLPDQGRGRVQDIRHSLLLIKNAQPVANGFNLSRSNSFWIFHGVLAPCSGKIDG
jgi:hypothetical protein